ncbi:MAG: Cell shape-determining protein MreC [Candidatus Falkowbacteria bacterium GW2011_GWC2_38_22]|uniref:Cell shape-determining protein MreC n=1 Tax=Candidatus Falkowbacteria bacterium GW2011_GWE1_38_31 TaxID=1618638 RepID=A0A0G0JS25_9BACT|nr:MAG: Cell shape-determining protein MreC [Candidatus Falkowbacteria bacterium GW2011_GWF2_38_1205]KKQ61518.1 MAG: Cell shape-determining protein MreC [Candidatus Falkowbacteria bacterium GW2011_GWC2_38_22]KKQ63589.1 MAG: Cell shape-determining protein MreC [Candidatus Falkowbacteria bacterium GW2011_GWF1_38_22]KKQ65741.1 MAG: Cell shape-determining protein MreC [Candidatus Falkowbacteria bacterium GW2011_GWE2_38_254]KKQ70358.1 MAG: Cell shape-determining protein MreC [Candidatus Falkowbacter
MLIKHRKKVFWLAALGLLVFLHAIGVLRPLENSAVKILNPLAGKLFLASTKIRVAFQKQTAKSDFAQIVKDLETEVGRLSEENASLLSIKNENEILREHLGFLERNKYKYVMANVISREDVLNVSGQTESIIIDKGGKDGLYSGLAVINKQGVVIGKIAEVKENSAQVHLVNSDKCKFAATVLGEEHTSGIAQGSLGLVIKMGYIPQATIIKAGDMVATSGLEQPIPRGLVIGKVTEIQKENNDLWQTATIEPIQDLGDLIIVSVVLPDNQ